MKKLLIALCFIFVFVLNVYAEEPYDYDENLIVTTVRVNIEEGTVTVNGENVECARPYLSENGVTMVAMTAITDAAGAEVKTEGDAVTVAYEETELLYTINSADMSINSQTISMPERIVRLEDGSIMVPMRFFAESLGADVVYDTEKAEAIAEISGGGDSDVNFRMLLKYSSADKIGNSKQKWRFSKPENFDLEDDWGGYIFYLDDVRMSFTASKNKEKLNIDQIYVMSQPGQDYFYYNDFGVLYEKTKGERSGLPYVCYRIRHTDSITEMHIFLSGDYIYTFFVQRVFESFASEKMNSEVEKLLDSFETGYSGGDEDNTVDISKGTEKKEKKEEYIDGNLRWSVKLSENWTVNEYYGFFNHVELTRESELNENDDDYSDGFSMLDGDYSEEDERYVPDAVIRISTYSLTEPDGISARIEKCRELLKAENRADLLKMSDIRNASVGEKSAKAFDAEIKYTDDFTQKNEYYYIADGAYCYEIKFTYASDDGEQTGFLETAHGVINSFKPGVIDSEEIGSLLEADDILETDKITKEFDGKLLSLTLPCTWSVRESGDSVMIINRDMGYMGYYGMSGYGLGGYYGYNDYSDMMITISRESLVNYEDDMTKTVKTLEEYVNKDIARALNLMNKEDCGIPEIEPAEMFGKKAYKAKLKVKSDENSYRYVNCIYVELDSENIILILQQYSDIYENTYFTQVCDKIIGSIKLK